MKKIVFFLLFAASYSFAQSNTAPDSTDADPHISLGIYYSSTIGASSKVTAATTSLWATAAADKLQAPSAGFGLSVRYLQPRLGLVWGFSFEQYSAGFNYLADDYRAEVKAQFANMLSDYVIANQSQDSARVRLSRYFATVGYEWRISKELALEGAFSAGLCATKLWSEDVAFVKKTNVAEVYHWKSLFKADDAFMYRGQVSFIYKMNTVFELFLAANYTHTDYQLSYLSQGGVIYPLVFKTPENASTAIQNNQFNAQIGLRATLSDPIYKAIRRHKAPK
ncbi:MAG: hypothetical protein RI894_1419 [Bacteroidota bacterium]|jgi:hypothetical protein